MNRLPAFHQHPSARLRSRPPGCRRVLRILIFFSLPLMHAVGANLALQTLYEFGSSAKNPRGALLRGSDGNFYGMTVFGGTNTSNGTVFRITPAGLLSVLHAFQG